MHTGFEPAYRVSFLLQALLLLFVYARQIFSFQRTGKLSLSAISLQLSSLNLDG
jgi:hypothetical protein